MEYTEARDFSTGQLVNLYQAVGWTAYTRSPEKLAPMIHNCWYTCAAAEQEKLIGLVRVVGDGHSVAYIQDLLVLPEYQRRGIASELMQRVLDRITENDIRQTFITTDESSENRHVVDFYQSLGFQPTPDYHCVTLARMA